MVQQRELFSELLRVADHMKAFVSHRMDGEEELRLRLEQSETNLAATWKAATESAEALKRSEEETKALRTELKGAKSWEEATGARLNEAQHEKVWLGKEVKELRTNLSLEKKQKEDLQLRLIAQRKELEVGLAVQRKELEMEYQK